MSIAKFNDEMTTTAQSQLIIQFSSDQVLQSLQRVSVQSYRSYFLNIGCLLFEQAKCDNGMEPKLRQIVRILFFAFLTIQLVSCHCTFDVLV